MLELKLFLFAQGVRFLFFDYKLFARIRGLLGHLPLIKTLLRCPFCQGFWCGFFTFLFAEGIVDAVLWGFASAIVSLTWYALVIPKLDEIESTPEEKTNN